MYRVRTTKTAPKNTAVQIVTRGSHKITVIKHIGTAKNDDELQELIEKAHRYILQTSKATPLLPEVFKDYNSVRVDDLEFTNAYYTFAYDFFSYFYDRCGFKKW